ncbi:MAG: spiralin lipoprotein [Spiroplasma phoeniceum]|nr:MAG: spiralin lipoprotein [Spiroplasma phoeniceum]UZQ33483.1 MAG: spiralin lipoprotein [Spiroplasma phoeniceum]
MKKLLSILAVFGISAVGTTSVIACNKNESNNLSRIKTIAAPATLKAKDPAKVTKSEIKKVLDPIVLKAVQGVVKTAQETDFVYEVYADNNGKLLDNVDLQAGKIDVYFQVTPAKDKTVVIGKSGYIKVTLSKIDEVKKIDISIITLPEQNVKIKTSEPTMVTKTKLEEINKDEKLIKTVLTAIQAKASGVEATDFAITNNGEDGGNYSVEKPVEVTVKANNSSAKITGKFKFNAKVTASN